MAATRWSLAFIAAGLFTAGLFADGLFADGLAAQPMTANGVTFSDEYGGFTIAAVSGSGSTDDPFIVVEEITGPTSVVLVIMGIGPDFGNKVGTLHPMGFALRKIVRNKTPYIWNFMEFELQQILGVSSDYLDGLSFGQGSVSGRPFTSNRFNDSHDQVEPIDMVTFSGGAIRPGESAVFNVIITDTTPIPVFYLVQQPNRPMARLFTHDAAYPGTPPW